MNAIETILMLCTLSPCYVLEGALHVPVPEVSPYTWPELYPGGELGGLRVWFVPMPRGA